MKKVVKNDFSISGLSTLDLARQFLRLKRMPVIDIAEGPKLKYLAELFWLHTLGYIWVKLDLEYPTIYRIISRISNSLKFRYNHYRRVIKRKYFSK